MSLVTQTAQLARLVRRVRAGPIPGTSRADARRTASLTLGGCLSARARDGHANLPGSRLPPPTVLARADRNTGRLTRLQRLAQHLDQVAKSFNERASMCCHTPILNIPVRPVRRAVHEIVHNSAGDARSRTTKKPPSCAPCCQGRRGLRGTTLIDGCAN